MRFKPFVGHLRHFHNNTTLLEGDFKRPGTSRLRKRGVAGTIAARVPKVCTACGYLCKRSSEGVPKQRPSRAAARPGESGQEARLGAQGSPYAPSP